VLGAHGGAEGPARGERGQVQRGRRHDYHLLVGYYPIATSQYSSTTLYQVSYHIQYLLF
jgi:hypothetical protein